MTPLTYSELLKTFAFEVGLGLIAYVGFCLIAPRIRRRAEERYDTFSWKRGIPSKPISMLLGLPLQPTITVSSKTAHFKTWILWMFIQGFIFAIAIATPTFELITSVGWKLPFQDHLYYNLLFATANGGLNGAHLTSYLGVFALMLFVSWKTKDVILGVLSGALAVGLHEGLWMIFYYVAYAHFLQWFMLPNVLKDVIAFGPMCILFIVGFLKYPYNKMQLKDFSALIAIYIDYLAMWFVLPLILGFSNPLPIRTANLPNSAITSGFANMTPWFYDPWVNLTEIVSWLLVTVGVMIIFAKVRD